MKLAKTLTMQTSQLQHTPAICSIAGSDCSGGAGIQADLKTFSALRIYGVTVLTAITAQNSCALQAVHVVPASWVKQQLEAVRADLTISAFKIGMLGSEEIMHTVMTFLRDYKEQYPELPVIIDPVLGSSSGGALTNPELLIKTFRQYLPALGTLVTPNLAEAARLSGTPLAVSVNDMETQAKLLFRQYQIPILLKGGHLTGKEMTDIFWDGIHMQTYTAPVINTRNLRGTGCTLSSAIAVFMVKGYPLPAAIAKAKSFISHVLEQGKPFHLGQCGGPLGHFDYA